MAPVVLLPVKGFVVAKGRLSSVLDADERAALARKLADIVADAAGPLPLAVVTDDAAVAAWAGERHAIVVADPGRGLSAAVQHGVAVLGDLGFDRVIAAHADLPYATSLGWLADFDGITLVPDRHDDGTNVIAVPPSAGFVFAYGPSSFSRHLTEALATGVAVRVVRHDDLATDVDTPADLELIDALVPGRPRR